MDLSSLGDRRLALQAPWGQERTAAGADPDNLGLLASWPVQSDSASLQCRHTHRLQEAAGAVLSSSVAQELLEPLDLQPQPLLPQPQPCVASIPITRSSP